MGDVAPGDGMRQWRDLLAAFMELEGYDIPRCRRFLGRRGIKCRNDREGIETSDRLGRHPWVVERALAWSDKYRPLTIRYERRADIHQGFLSLGCALFYRNFLGFRRAL